MQGLEEFYADPRRRDSRELRFGLGWRSANYEFFEFSVFWLAATDELCLLRAPMRDARSDGVFSRFILGVPPHFNPEPMRDHEVAVEVLARVEEARLLDLLDGWEEHRGESDGVSWLRSVAEGSRPGS